MTLEHPIVPESQKNSKELWKPDSGTEELAESCSHRSIVGRVSVTVNEELRRTHELLINKGGGGKCLFTAECGLVRVEMREGENHRLATVTGITDSGRNQSGCCHGRQACWEQHAYPAKHLPADSLLITEGGESAFTVGTAGRRHLNQVIQVNSTKMRHTDITCLPTRRAKSSRQ